MNNISINFKYPNLERMDSYPEYGDNNFKNRSGATSFIEKRHRAYQRKISLEDRMKAGVGALIGTTIAMSVMMKQQNVKTPFKLKYGLKEMVALSGASVTCGILCGMIGENEITKKNKLKEGVFQFLNAAIPTWMVAGTLKLAEESKRFNNNFGKILSTVGGLIIGMYGAASISNLICDPKDKHPDRKLELKDCLINLDDAIGILVLAKFPLINKLHLDKLLPVIYTYCGYRAGKCN